MVLRHHSNFCTQMATDLQKFQVLTSHNANESSVATDNQMLRPSQRTSLPFQIYGKSVSFGKRFSSGNSGEEGILGLYE